MDPNIATVVYSTVYVFTSILVCGMIEKHTSEFFARKLLHILVGNAVIFPIIFNADLWAAALPPLAFIFINHVLQEFGIFEADTGLIFYPFSILILVFLSYLTSNPLYLIIPSLLMAYGDALASIFGRVIFHRSEKSVEGSVIMFLVSLAISSFFLTSFSLNPLWSFVIAAVASIAEMEREDNLTVPLYTAVALTGIYAPINMLIKGFGITLIASSLAYYMKALTFTGLAGAVVLGSVIFSISPPVFLALFLFFFSSSILTRYKEKEKEGLEDYQKIGKRDAVQVLANGFGAAFGAALMASGTQAIGFAIASIAAATADTWATELGTLSKRKPVLITTLREVEKGRSGGITPLGLFASLLAGAFIFLALVPFLGIGSFKPAIVGSIFGSLLDSLLGATVQGTYMCRVCRKITERRRHCGKAALLIRGFEWFNNDIVNLVSTLLAGALVMI